MTNALCRRLACLLLLIGMVAADRAPQKSTVFDGAFVFRGRWIGVTFKHQPQDGPMLLSLQFLVEDPIADLCFQEPGTFMPAGVATNIQLDPATLTAANYFDAIESAVGHGVHLGDSCLVVGQWTKGPRKEMRTIEPATPEAEARLRAAYPERIIIYRRANNKARPSALLMRLGSLERLVQENIETLQANVGGPDEYRDGLLDAVKHYVDGFRTDYAWQKETLASRMSELSAAIEAADDEFEKNTLGLMLDDLKQIDSQVEQKRASVMQRLRDAGLESLLPE